MTALEFAPAPSHDPGETDPVHYGSLVPEGHTIHRLADDLADDLAGGAVVASSPQGRFTNGAARLDGQLLDRSEAWGKHLFLWWSSGELLHVHLGLIGKFRRVPAMESASDTVRLRLERDDVAWQLTGPQTCAVVTPPDRETVVAALGPDPLRRGARRREQFATSVRGSHRPLGAALLDQGIIAGIGNVYRSELLFLLGIHPERRASELSADDAGRLWDVTVDQLRRGKRWNRIVTVESADVGRRITRTLPREDAHYVYKRGGEPCRRCQEPIDHIEIAGRSMWFCPTCQPR